MNTEYSRLIILGLTLMISMGFADNSRRLNEAPDIRVDNAWVRAVLPVQKSTALYMTITNNSNKELRLIDVRSPMASRTMIHQTVEEEGIAKMRHQPSLVIAPGDSVIFKPGGLHVMFMGLSQAVIEGEKVGVTLIFEGGRQLEIEAAVRA